MPAYIFADLDVHDWDSFQRYREQMPALLAKFGGRYLIRGGDTEIAEGNFGFKRLIVIEFPDMKSAKALYNNPAYQPLKELRLRTTTSNVAFVAGHEG